MRLKEGFSRSARVVWCRGVCVFVKHTGRRGAENERKQFPKTRTHNKAVSVTFSPLRSVLLLEGPAPQSEKPTPNLILTGKNPYA